MALLLTAIACRVENDRHFIRGETMGTTYHITYYGHLSAETLKPGIDSLLQALNAEVSTYIPASVISRFNASTRDTVAIGPAHRHFLRNLLLARKIYLRTDGYFDPTVMPLVNYWGFGYKGHRAVTSVDSAAIDSLRRLVGMDKLVIAGDTLIRRVPGIQLDFSAIAKGYGVDLVAEWLEDRGIKSYLVEIGGEDRAKGLKPGRKSWVIGIAIPRPDASPNDFRTTVRLDDRAMATSGNYRNYHFVNGQMYSHTINPKTGFPKRDSLLSASVLAPDCASADALATACMAMGFVKAKNMLSRLDSCDFILKVGTPGGSIRTILSDPKLEIR